MSASIPQSQLDQADASQDAVPGLEARGISRRFSARRAVQCLSLSVRRGEVVGLLGRNGAGKSTTLRMLSGTLAPDSGSVQIAGYDMARQPLAARQQLGFLADGSIAFPELTVTENMFFAARVRGFDRRQARAAVHDAIETFRLGPLAQRLCGRLSAGQRQRAALATTLLHRPAAAILDEPSTGLDPTEVRALHTIIGAQSDCAVLLSTHSLEEVRNVCHRALIIDAGVLVREVTLRSADKTLLTTFVRLADPPAIPRLAQLAAGGSDLLGHTSDTVDGLGGGRFLIHHASAADEFARTLAATAAREQWGLVELSPRAPSESLEAAFDAVASGAVGSGAVGSEAAAV